MAKSHKKKKPTGGPQHRIFLVEDHPVFRDGLAKLLNAETDLAVCGEAGDARTALKNIRKLQAGSGRGGPGIAREKRAGIDQGNPRRKNPGQVAGGFHV